MTLAFWADLCKIATICGSIIALLGTIGQYTLGKILDQRKNQRIEQLEKGNVSLEKELKETAKLAEPATLKCETAVKNKEVEGLCATILFKASKNESLGQLEFVVEIEGESDSKIIKLWPSLKGGAFQSGKNSYQPRPDNKSAVLIYTPLGANYAAFDITISKPTIVKITGNRLPEPCTVKID